jgi:hypothetical protein
VIFQLPELNNPNIYVKLFILENARYKNIFCNDFANIYDINDNTLVIYPEIITGNPLNGNYVVRYMLNREGFIKAGIMMNSSHQDFILTHSYLYHQDPHFHLFNYNGSEYFNRNETEQFNKRKIDLTYIGKGSKYTTCSLLHGTQEVTREWPATKLELANLLKKTKYIYTWDTLSATVTDAILCGAFPIFMTYVPITKDEVYNMIDLKISIPEVTYAESLGQLSTHKLEEVEEFIGLVSKKIKESESNWEQNVDTFSLKVMEHFGILSFKKFSN